MQDILRDCAGYLWLALGIFWLAGAITAKPSARTQSPASRLLQITPEIAAFFLLFGRFPWPSWLRWRFTPDSLASAWIGLALTAAGIAFAIWARLWIGRNWSGRVTIKEQHELVQKRPVNAIVRHPIYSGFLLAILGTAVVQGELRSLLALPLAALGWTFKLRLEETFMTQQFGNVYLDYKRRVKALVPFLV